MLPNTGHLRHRGLRVAAEPARQALPVRAEHAFAAGGLPGALAAGADTDSDTTPRWLVTGLLVEEPRAALVMPVRDIRVMYALKSRHYNGFAESQIPHPHEYFVPMDALTAKDAYLDPAMQDLVSRASATANFLTFP